MKSSVKLAILKILSLKEEFTDGDLTDAVAFISKNKTTDILTLLSETSSQSTKKIASKSTSYEVPKTLREENPAFFNAINNLVKLTSSKKILKNLDEINQFGKLIDNNFAEEKTERAALKKVIETAANNPTQKNQEVIEAYINKTTDLRSSEKNSIKELSEFLIDKGRK